MRAYAEVRRDEAVEELHGWAVADPCRWLEDAGSDETAAFAAHRTGLTASAGVSS